MIQHLSCSLYVLINSMTRNMNTHGGFSGVCAMQTCGHGDLTMIKEQGCFKAARADVVAADE